MRRRGCVVRVQGNGGSDQCRSHVGMACQAVRVVESYAGTGCNVCELKRAHGSRTPRSGVKKLSDRDAAMPDLAGRGGRACVQGACARG